MTFHKNQPIWWDAHLSKACPPWMPKGRDSQAGWFNAFTTSNEKSAVITVLTPARNIESYVVLTEHIRPRMIY